MSYPYLLSDLSRTNSSLGSSSFSANRFRHIRGTLSWLRQAAALLDRRTLAGLFVICAILWEQLSPNAWNSGFVPRFVSHLLACLGGGLFLSEVARRRTAAITHGRALAEQVRLRETAELQLHGMRETAEQQLHGLIEGSPAAILTMDAEGKVVLANEAAQGLLDCQGRSLVGQSIDQYPPALDELRLTSRIRSVRTMLECTGYRSGGEAFLAHAWVSSYGPPSATGLSAVLFDSSENLRHNEETGLHTLSVGARIASGAFWHEARNMCSAMRVLIGSLKRRPSVADTEEMEALVSLVNGLEKLASDELYPSAMQSFDIASLRSVLDHLRIVIEPSFQESHVNLHWQIADNVPVVRADHHGLLQVFINLARNAGRAMADYDPQQLTVSATVEASRVLVHFHNTGQPVKNPELLFQPFQPAATEHGVGLYVSRAILRSFGGDIRYEPVAGGCCFEVTLALGDLYGDGSR